MGHFSTRFSNYHSHRHALLDLFLLTFCSIAFPQLGNSDHVVFSIYINFPPNSKGDVLFHRKVYDHSRMNEDGLHDHLRDVLWKAIFKVMSSIFYQIFIFSPNDNPSKTMKSVFYALFILEVFKFL